MKFMKKILFIAIALLALQTSFAQTFTKGDTFVEGTFGYRNNTSVVTNETTGAVSLNGSTGYSINPSVGHFLTDKFAVGASLSTGQSETQGISKTTSFGYGVFARCYFLNIGEHFKAYTQVGVSGNDLKTDRAKATELNAGISLGGNYFVSKNLALTFAVADLAKYGTSKTLSGDSFITGQNNSFGLSGVNNPLNATTFGLLYRF
jgi:outer membrane protein